jgi:hypothetical protein
VAVERGDIVDDNKAQGGSAFVQPLPIIFKRLRQLCLKTPYRDGTTHIVLEPVDFMARLAALVPPPRHVAMTWAARLKRVFNIEIEPCARCGGRLQVIASIEQPELSALILAHRRGRGAEAAPVSSLGPRAPLVTGCGGRCCAP